MVDTLKKSQSGHLTHHRWVRLPPAGQTLVLWYIYKLFRAMSELKDCLSFTLVAPEFYMFLNLVCQFTWWNDDIWYISADLVVVENVKPRNHSYLTLIESTCIWKWNIVLKKYFIHNNIYQKFWVFSFVGCMVSFRNRENY